MKKTLKAILSITLIATGLTLSGCSVNRDPMKIYQSAATKTQTVKTGESVISFGIQSTVNGKTDKKEIITDMMTDYTNKQASGKMTMVSGTDRSLIDIYSSGDYIYTQVPARDLYLKSNTKQSQLSNQTISEYSDKILQLIKASADEKKNVNIVNNNDKSKTITFTIPADKTKSLVKDIIVKSLTNEDVKKAAVDQAVAQMKQQYSGKEISEDQIKKIISSQMDELTKTIDSEFGQLTFDNLKYTVNIDKKGFITKQEFLIGVKDKSNKKMVITATNELKSINSDVKVNLPKFTKDNTTDSLSINQVFMNMLAQ